ncbi:Uroporphyrinogen III methyltransferase / synthase [Hondaea fermentalgiana]|uniref:uroporphyrinogen-III C-methyltransferase n=1 Tax=Hondaea fermentalgiana TaxID=2315210 RepID=A0A2R5GVX4_9STRA|nr:Uroporphyrinogen III methyltransferase / synthase [Hondaea fermentalgiana]|eukprot:GBG32813.1 Uroporphyrinogen III methyltransferase / synthase [Hondaea fermentalgiana]
MAEWSTPQMAAAAAAAATVGVVATLWATSATGGGDAARALWGGGSAGRRGGRRVVLVGAGPGSADLITVRGARAIAEADFLVHDRLVSPELVAMAKPGVTLVNVGKAPTKKRFPQSEINQILVDLATNAHAHYKVPENASIVRLKGGDPFIYGLGGDEVMALREAGLACEVVPGLSSATAVPACAGIPVTQKGVATSFTVLTGHVAPGEPGAADWAHVPRQDATLVVLMGVKNMRKICSYLVSSVGWAASTPAAAIQSGTTTGEVVVRGTLTTLADKAEQASLASPTILVIGQVCDVLEPGAVIPYAQLENLAKASDGTSQASSWLPAPPRNIWGLARPPPSEEAEK